MTKGNELYYEYRKKLNKENNTRKVYKREDDQGSGTRNERYINDVLGGEGQAVSAQPAPPVAPAKTRESLLSEYRSALGQRMAAQSPQQTLMNVAESRVQFDQQQAARRRQTNSGPMRSAQPTNPEQKLPGSPYIGTENSLGRYGKGNIDLYNRPQYRNPDGSVSTVRSISIGTDDGEVLIPTVGRDANGRPRLMSDDEAIDEYFRTGNNLGVFKSIEEADDYADRLHKQQDAYYTGKGRELPSLEQMANPMRYAETRRQTAGGNSTVESSTVDRMLQAAKQSEARAAEQKEQTYQRNAVNAFGNPNARAGGNWHTTPTGAWGAQDQTGRFISPQSQRYEQDYRDTDPMRRLAAERVSAQDAENPLNTRGNTKPYSVMTDDEKSVYNYLYSTYGPARAEEYHNGLMDEINRRIGQENYEANTNDLNTAQKTLRSYQQGLSSGIEGILNAPAALMGAENRRARSAAEYENSALRSDQENNTAQKILYDIASSTGNMTPGMMASALGAPAAVGSTLFATSAGGNAYAEAMNAGEDISTSRAYAVQQFADEEATNWLLGGINAFGGGAVRKVMQNSAAGRTLDAAVNRLVKTESGRRMLHMMMDYVGDMAGEAQQEYVQFYTENFTKAILGMKDESGNPIDFNFNPADPDALYAALLGALNAGALNAAPAAARVIHGSGTDVQNAGGLAEDLRNTTREDYTSDAAYESAMRLEAVAREIGDRQAAGRSPSAMDRIAFNEAMSEFIEASTESEAESEEENPRTGFVDESGLTLPEITEGARQLREAENRTDVTGAEPSEAEPSRMTIPAEMKEQAAYDLLETRRPERIQWTDGTGTFVMQREADEGYSVTNQMGETSGLTEDQAAQMLPADTELTITWGEQRQEEQVKPTVTPESLPSYEASAPVAGINARNINTGVDNRLMALAQDVTQERTQQKAAQMQSVYDAGKNMQAENLRSVMNGATMLTEQEKQVALRRGMQEAVAAARTQTAQATNAAVQKIRIPGVKEGKVSYDPKVDQSKLTEGQKVNGALAGAFASKVFGANVVLTQSNVVNGRYEGANGWFRFGGADDQTFYFDVNAGKNRVSDWKNSPFDATSVMPVIAHEGTHWMEKNHPEAYKGLEDQVLDALSKDKAYTRNGELSLDDIISLEQKRMDREEPHADGRPHTVEEAKAELVARGCEDMLNGNEYAKAAFSDLDVEAKKTLWGHIKGVFESIQRFFDELLKNYRSNSQEARAIRRNKEAYAELLKTYGEILGMGREETASADSQNLENAFGDDTGEVIRDNDGNAVIVESEDGKSIAYSLRTLSTTQEKLAAVLKRKGYSEDSIKAAQDQVRNVADMLTRVSTYYAEMAEALDAELLVDPKTGKTVLHSFVTNGDYPVNIDFLTICKKREAYMHVLTDLIEHGIFDKVAFNGAAIATTNEILRDAGFETACACCFVESRRLQIQRWAETFCSEWNEEVLKRNPNATPFNFSKGERGANDLTQDELLELEKELRSVTRKEKNPKGNIKLPNKGAKANMGPLLDRIPALAHTLSVGDLITPNGIDSLRATDGNLFSLVKQRYGTATPKITQSFSPYSGDVADLNYGFMRTEIHESIPGSKKYKDAAKRELAREGIKKPTSQQVEDRALRKYLYDIGGVRLQSFSDFLVENTLDYFQMFADLAAKELPLHAYSKEISFIKMFGMTGGKMNMSLIPVVDLATDKEHAGLKKNKDGTYSYAGWGDYEHHLMIDNRSFIQSIGFKDAIALQLHPGYSSHIGTIAIGISNAHIRKMLNDPLIRMVIPYHSSGMLPEFAKQMHIDYYHDYTTTQNTTLGRCTDMDGNEVEVYNLKGKNSYKCDTHFDFNEAFQRLGDAREACEEYKEWCKERHPVYKGSTQVGWAEFTPKFVEFATERNYYKLIEDFNSYDCITEEPAVQGAVTMSFPGMEQDLLNDKELKDYEERLRATGQFTEKEIQKYVSRANETLEEIVTREAKNRNAYHREMDKKYDSTLNRIETTLQRDYNKSDYDLVDNKYVRRDEIQRSVRETTGKVGAEAVARATEESVSAMIDNGYTQREAAEAVEAGGVVQYSTRTTTPPKKTITAYKAFYAMDGKLYPPMVANDVEEEQNRGVKKVSGTLKGLETPVGIWIDADVGALAYDDNGKPLRNTKGRLAVKNAKGGGTLAFRPGWHLGLWPDAKQFNVKDPVTGELKACMPDGLVFARCSVAADNDYQLEALGYGMKDNGKFDRTQAGLPRIPTDGYYMYRTNVDPTTAPWIISGAIRVEEILDDDMAAEICKQYGITADPRASHKKINLADYGLKAGPVAATEDTDRFLPNDAVKANAAALEEALNDPEYANAYVAKSVNFDDPEIIKELERNGQSSEFYKAAQEKYGNNGYAVNNPNDSLINKNTFAVGDGSAQYSARNASSDLNLLKAERLSEKYVKELEDTISERDTQIAELQEQMEKAVGAEKEKRKQQLAKLRKEKNDRIAYLEKSYRVNLNWQIAEMRQKMDRAIGEEKAQAKERLDALRAQKNQKIEEILQKNREQREQRRFNRSAQELIKRARRLKKMKGSPTFRAQVDALIGDLDLISPGMKDNTRQRLQKLKEEVEAQAALDPDYAKYEAVKYDKFLDRLKKKQIKDMTLDDIISIAEALAALEHSKKTADREIKEGQGKLFADYGRTAVAQLKKTKGINYGNEIGSMLGRYRLNMLNPTRAFQLLDGYQKDGVFTYFAKELNDGQTRAAEFRQKAEAMFQEIDNNPNLVNDFAKQNIEIMTVEGMKKISKGMRISLYLHAKNLDNVKHISYGGITIPNESLYRRGKYSEAYTAGETVHLIPQDSKNPDMMAAKAIRAITDQMTPEEKQYADIAYKFLNETTKEAINEVSLALDGYEKATVEDYVPIRSDPNFTQASMEGLLKDGTIEGMGMLKERTGSRNPILLEDASQVVLRQKNNTAMYYGLAIPIRNFNRFYNYTGTGFARSVKQSVGKTWGAAGQKYIDNVISDLQFGRQTQRTVLDSMKGLYAGTTLNLNLGVSIKQSASYPFAASVIGWAPLAKALGQRFTAADRAYMDSLTPWGYMRRTGFSGTEMGEVARQRTGIDNNQTIQKAKTMLDFIRRVDVATTEKLFKACENYVQEKYPDLEVMGEEYGKKLAEIYNETLQRTQPSYDVMQRNEFLRSQNDLTKVLGAFKTQTFNMGGEILDAYGKWRAHSEYAKIDSSYETMAKESGKAFRTTVAATIVAQAMLVALSAVANAVLHKMKPYRDDKGEVTAESLAKKVMQDFATSFAGLTMGGSEAQAAVMAVFGAEKWYDIEYPGLSMINELVSSITDFSTAVRKSLDKDNAKAAEDRQKASVRLGKVLMQVFKLNGIPSQNLYNIANMVYLHGQDLANDELGSFTAGKGLFGLTDTSPTGKQFAKQAFYYYGKGDVSKGTKAAKRASESGIKDEMGGNQEKAIEYMKKSNLDEKTLKMLWELAGWKANTFDKKMEK